MMAAPRLLCARRMFLHEALNGVGQRPTSRHPGSCGARHPESSNSLRADGGGGGGSRRSTTGGAVGRNTTGGEARGDSILRWTSPRVGRAGPRRARGRARAGGRRGAMRMVGDRDAAWRRARAAAASRACATRALARAFAKRLLAARAEGGRRSGAGDANDGTGGAGAVSATLALSLAPGAGAARSTMSGTIIPMAAAATTAQRLHAFLPIIRSHPRRLAMRRRRGAAIRPSAIRASEQRHGHTVHRTRRLPAKNKGHGTEEAKQHRAQTCPACWTMSTNPLICRHGDRRRRGGGGLVIVPAIARWGLRR
jgi:hypothetical protein